MLQMRSRGVVINVIDKALIWNWNETMSAERMAEKMKWLFGRINKRLAKENGTLILIGSTGHPYFSCYRIKQVELTTKDHPYYTQVSCPNDNFVGSELMVLMERPAAARICWIEPDQKKAGGKSLEVFLHPEESEWKHKLGYIKMMSPRDSGYDAFLIIGEEDCLAQLRIWGIDQKELEGLF